MKSYIIVILALLICFYSQSQENKNDRKNEIPSILENYFDLEREAIHLQLSKASYLTHESIWYKGYIVNRKTNKPYFTTNVFVLLYDADGKQLSEKLIYATNGVFAGKIDLLPTYKTGEYFLQVYTNWMNNFSENESTLTKISIVNPEEGIKNYRKVNPETLEITFHPEGKSYINGIPNQMGIQLKDCRGNAPEDMEVLLQNDQNEIIKTIKLNQFGLGKFETTPTTENLKVRITFEDKIIVKQLPQADELGYSMTVNNFTIEGKTIVDIKTNAATANLMKDKKIYLLTHQDQKYSLYDLAINPSQLETNIIINNNNLFEGINSVRIIDSDLKQWGERLIYTSIKNDNQLTISKNKNIDDKINLVAVGNFQNSNIGVSVLPEDTKSISNNSIIAGINVNPYLVEPLENATYYLNNLGRRQRYELDLVLLNQEKLKYDWTTIKISQPKANYSFDIGISLKGIIDPSIQKKTYHKMKLVSYLDLIMSSADVNEKGEYQFDHLLLADSTFVRMSLEKLPDFEVINTKITPQVLNRKRAFNKPFQATSNVNCPAIVIDEAVSDFEFPNLDNAIRLKELKIINDPKKLLYEKVVGNGFLRAFKVDKSMDHKDLLVFVEQNGFTVTRSMGEATIYSRVRASLNSAQATPIIVIDGQTAMSQSEFTMLRMEEIDEIYLDPNAIVPSMNNNQGIIKVYRKKNYTGGSTAKQNQNAFYIKQGFAPYFNFKNSSYQNTQSKGFQNYGSIDWLPMLYTKEDGTFTFNITNYNQNKAKIIIEGIDKEGQLFHEERTVELK